MKKGSPKSKQNLETTAPRRRKYDDEFKQQAVAMVRNGQSVRSVAQVLGISENLLHQWKRAARDSHFMSRADETYDSARDGAEIKQGESLTRRVQSAPRSLSARCETFDNQQGKDVKAKQHWCPLK